MADNSAYGRCYPFTAFDHFDLVGSSDELTHPETNIFRIFYSAILPDPTDP